jgi:hypothetical protein
VENAEKENNVPGTHENVFKIYESGIKINKSSIMRLAGHVARMGERRGAYRILVGKYEGKRPLGRPRHRWEDIIKTDLQKVG